MELRNKRPDESPRSCHILAVVSRILTGLLVLIAFARVLRQNALASDPVPDQPAVSQGPFSGTRLAITVDDLPGTGVLPPGTTRMDVARTLLLALQRNRVPAWGFANGVPGTAESEQVQVDSDREGIEILRMWLLAGYPLGNHSYHHGDLRKLTAEAYISDIEKMDLLLQSLAPLSSLLEKRRVYRFPYLSEGDTPAKRNAVRAYLAEHGYSIAWVTVDYLDYAWAAASTRCLARGDSLAAARLEAEVILAAEHSLRAARANAQRLFGRDIAHILLIHANAFTAQTFPATIRHLRSNGVRMIPLDVALDDPAYLMEPDVLSRGSDTVVELYPFVRIARFCTEESVSK